MAKKFVLLLLTVFFFSISPKAFAGGGPVSLEAFPLKPFSENQKFIVAANINTRSSCDALSVNFSFQDSASGDEITPFTPPNDGTYLKRHYYTGSDWQELCTKYVQVSSGEKRQRKIVAKTAVDGENYTRDYPLNFGEDEYSRQTQSFDRYNNQPQVDVTYEKYLGGPKREVGLQWNKVEGAAKYSVFMRYGEGTTPYDLPPLTITTDTKTVINLNAFEDFYLSVNACKEDNPCTKSQQNPWEYLLPRMRGNSNDNAQIISELPTPQLIPIPPTELNPNDDKLNDLNKKVAELEKKLQASEKKQNILEQKFNELLKFLRNILPFLR